MKLTKRAEQPQAGEQGSLQSNGAARGQGLTRRAFMVNSSLVAGGAVVDWIDFHWGPHHWPAFNMADVSISIGEPSCLRFFAAVSVVPPRPILSTAPAPAAPAQAAAACDTPAVAIKRFAEAQGIGAVPTLINMHGVSLRGAPSLEQLQRFLAEAS